MSVVCPACNASNPDSALWCNQCFVAFSSPATATSGERELHIPAEPMSPATIEVDPVGEGGSDLSQPMVADLIDDNGDEDEDRVGAWTCQVCDSSNSIVLNVCAVCGTSIYDAFGAETEEQPDIEPKTAMLWALIPGMGHVKAGQGVLGLTVAALALFSAVAAVSFVSASQTLGATVFFVALLGVFVVSVLDAGTLAAGRPALLEGRRITVVAGVLVTVIILLIVAQLGGGV